MHSQPQHLAATSRLLSVFQQALGASTTTTYGNDCLQLVYRREVRDVGQLLEGLGMDVEANLTMPGTQPDAFDELVVGRCDDAAFMARSRVQPNGESRLEVQIYASSGADAQRANRLLATYAMADVLFKSHDCADDALVSYVARRLHDRNEPHTNTKLVASIMDVLSGHLISSLPSARPDFDVQS